MAKIDIPNIASPYASQNALNVRFKMIEDALNDKVLWRDNPVGEVNTLKNDIDMGNNDLLNVGLVSASSIMVQGQGIEEGLTEVLNRCIEEADEAEASANAAANAASTAASDTVAAASSLLSGYVTSAEAAQTAAEQAKIAASTEAASAEASAIRAEEAAEQAELPIVSPGDEGKVLTVSPLLEKEWAEVSDELPPYSVAEAGKILKVSSLGEIEWGVEDDELPSYTPLDAGKTLTVNEVGDAVEWAAPPIGSVNIAPQAIIKAALGPRPDGWTAADCDAPVASLSYSGNAVTVEAGLQVAYADGGRVQLSEELVSPQTVDLSAADDGTHHVYADIAEGGTFSGFGATAVAPAVGIDRSNDVLPPFAGYTLEGWGTVSAVNEIAQSGHNAWRCLDGGPASAEVATYIGADGSWILTFTQPRTVKKMRIYPRAYTTVDWTANALGSANVLADGTQVATISKASYTGSGDFVEVDINSVCSVLTISSMLSLAGGSIMIGVIDIELGPSPRDLYNPVEVVMYDDIDNPIRRVYIGTVVKTGGAVTVVNCYALGDRVRLPATGTILDSPYGGWHVLAYQGTTVLNTSPTQISGVTINTTPVVVRR